MKDKKRHVGVELRGKRIQLKFCYKNEVIRESIARRPDETDMQSLDYADAFRKKVLDAIVIEERGGKPFAYVEFFPDSGRAKPAEVNAGNVAQGLEEWFAEHEFGKPSTKRCYRAAVKYWSAKIGHHKLSMDIIEPIEACIREMRAAQTTTKTIFNKLLPLRGMLDRAVKKKKLPINPLDSLEKMKRLEWEKIRKMGNKPDPLDVTDIQKIEAKATGQMRNMFLTNIYSGLRLGELFGLAYEDVDFNKGRASIKRTWVEHKLVTPKTDDSVRTIILLPPVLAALKAQRALTLTRPPMDCGAFGELHFVFINPFTGRPYVDDQQFRRPWTALLLRAGVRYRIPKQMRHTFASICISAGENVKWIAKHMGHSDTSMVNRVYGHWLEEAAAASGNEGGGNITKLWGDLGGRAGQKGNGNDS